MNQENILSSLKEIQNIVSKCIAELAKGASAETGAPQLQRATPAPTRRVQTLTELILSLKSEGYFKQPRLSREVRDKLSESYACDVDRVSMALLRLSNRKELRKATKSSKGRELSAYVW